ncbi:MAG: IS1380 family transposase [Actinobacteria bacterium]|nr:IS1380 family transposase [Actinomycetota bacterium]
MRSFEIVQSDTDTITSHAGLSLVGRALARTGLAKGLNQIPLRHGIAHADCVKSYLGLLCTGKSDFDAVENRREDEFFKQALDLAKVPSAPSLRQRFDDHAEAFIPHVDDASIAFIGSVGAPVTPILVKYGSSLRPQKRRYAPLDIDVFPMDNSGTKKEGVSYTYKGFDGYAPLAAYLGQEGWCVACELRPGSQHGQKEFIYFLERVVPRARELTQHRLLCRLDSGHDAAENRAWLAREGVDFIIKWNPRKQDLVAWLERAEKEAEWGFPREGKRVGTFSEVVDETFDDETRQHRRVIRVIERTIDKHGARLLVPEITVEGWWTSLGECVCADTKVIALYCDHATSEQFHSEFKTDLDIERLPSGKFATNDLVMACAVLAYNILRWIGLEGLTRDDAPIRHPAQRRRLKTVIQELMYVAARVVESGRRLALKFSIGCPAFPSFAAVHARLAAT